MKVDTEALPRLAARYQTRSIPNFIVFRDGKIFSQQAGLAEARTLCGWLERAAETNGVAKEPAIEPPAPR